MSQSVAALLKLREVILSGSMPPGDIGLHMRCKP